MTKIALIGNPNSGKTTLFNKLTGSNQYVGNWPGVTVEKKSGSLRKHQNIEIVDLPGIYSLSPYTNEEIITRDFLLYESVDCIINIVDSTNIERNLYLTTQLLEMKIPLIVALNMTDLLEHRGITIDISKLKKNLGCEVIAISASKGLGVESLLMALINKNPNTFKQAPYTNDVLMAIDRIKDNHPELGNSKDFIAIKLLERDQELVKHYPLTSDDIDAINQLELAYDDTVDGIIANQRYLYIQGIMDVVTTNIHKKDYTQKLDYILTHKWLGLPIFAGIMFLIYYLAVSSLGTMATDWMNDVFFGDIVYNWLSNILALLQTDAWLNALVLDGILAGVGAVLGFVPQIAILFLLLGILEDTGYMARIAFMLDRVFRRFNLSGKSIIPMLIGTGCSVPGIMASRTIENEDDRKLTIMTTSFIPCSAKLPIIALVAGALFASAWWVAPSIYLVGVLTIMVSGILLKKLNILKSAYSPFVMELPSYHLPKASNVIRHSLDKVKSFIVKAGTIIFVSSIVIWFLSNYNIALEMVDSENSMLASIGKFIAPIFGPLGFGNWQATIATINGLVAKESVVSALGILYGVQEVSEAGNEIWGAVAQSFNGIQAYSFLLFNMICIPCIAACGAIVREMNNTKWTLIALGYQTILAYVIAFCFNQIGSLIAYNTFGISTIIAFVLIIVFIYLVFFKKEATK